MTKLVTLTRRSTVQNFPPQLVFPGLINNLASLIVNLEHKLVQLTVIASSETEKKYINLDTHTHKQTKQKERETHTNTNRKTHTQTRQIDKHTCRKIHARRGAHAHTGMDTNKHTQKNHTF